ncbi:hypothetical protein QH637_02840 [Heyndrickxia coagulans]
MIAVRYSPSIKSEICNLLKNYPGSLKFINGMSNIGELLFFGGSIRDYYLYNGFKSMPRDFDIVVKVNAKNEILLRNLLGKHSYRKNRFGGYKVKIENIEFDLWSLKNTWAFREKKLLAEERNLTKSVFLSIDGIAYNFNKDILYAEELRWSIENKKINIVLKDNPQKELNLFRALVFKKKYNLDFSPELIEEFKRYIDLFDNFYDVLYKLQLSHYRKEHLTPKEVRRELEVINN